MGFYPFREPQATDALSQYYVFKSPSFAPSLSSFLIGTTRSDLGSFVMTEAWLHVDASATGVNGGTTAVIALSIGFNSPNYDDWVLTQSYGFAGSNLNNQLYPNVFRRYTPVATTAAGAGYAAGTPANAATGIYAKVTTATNITTELISIFVGGFYTGLK